MRIGTICPDGFLPAYSVDTEAEAKQLLVRLPLGLDGKYYAEELFDANGEALTGESRVDAFVRFGKRMESIHEQLSKLLKQRTLSVLLMAEIKTALSALHAVVNGMPDEQIDTHVRNLLDRCKKAIEALETDDAPATSFAIVCNGCGHTRQISEKNCYQIEMEPCCEICGKNSYRIADQCK